ncbi:MAG: acyltransferase family protein [Pseudomonadota bacterium]
MKFRADIEGLRGLSIVLVVLAHSGIPGLQGGFIGVDVFFVISGYLITGLLLEALHDGGRVDAWRFYARRVRRLLPAFILMVATTLVVATALLSPAEVARHAREAAWASAWAANLFQVANDTDYFASARETGLFLHTWSLAVEEQFYLAWPLVLWLAWKVAGGDRALRWTLALVLVGGFAYGLYATTSDPVAAYFLPHVRAWQFATGAIVYLVGDTFVPRPGAWASALATAGMTAILGGALLIGDSTPYPGSAALAPTLGAAALLLAGPGGGGIVSRTLASRIPTAIGRISYSWYLWHWPALVLAAELAPADGRARAVAVAASLVVAVIAFHCVEDPLRRSRRGPPRMVVLIGVMASLLLVAFCSLIHRSHRGPADPEIAPAHPIVAQIAVPEIYAAGCDQWYHSAALTPCRIELAGESAPTAVVIGDSIGLQWYPALVDTFRTGGWNMVVLTKSACAMVDRPFHYARIRREYTECARWRDAAVEYIRAASPPVVVVGSSGTYPFDVATWRAGSADFLRRIAAPGRRIAVLGPTPSLPFDAPSCLMRGRDGLPLGPETDDCAVPLSGIAFAEVEGALRDAVAATPGATYIDGAAIACPDSRCAAWRDGQLVFRDTQHLNAAYASALAPRLRAELEPLLKGAAANRE